MTDTSDKIVEMYAYQMLHLPEDSLAYQNTREDFAAMFRALVAERNALRIALMPFAVAAPLDLTPEMDDQYVDSSSDMFYDLTYGYFRKARVALSTQRDRS
jgi:hypothetical protein